MTNPSHDSEARRLEDAEQQVFDEQESNARATAGMGPRDDDQADEWAAEAAREGSEALGEAPVAETPGQAPVAETAGQAQDSDTAGRGGPERPRGGYEAVPE